MTDLAPHRDRLLAFFRDRKTVAGVVARRALGAPRADDAELVDHLIRERRRRSALDGSIDHALLPTARALSELLYLGAPGDHAAVVRLSGFLLGRQDLPGRWGESDGRGKAFFSPGPIDTAIAPLALYSGLVIEDEDEARLAASCIALRQVLRAGHEARAGVRAHVEALLALGPDGVSAAIAGLALPALAVAAPDQRARVSGWSARLSETALPPAHRFAALVPVPEVAARQLLKDWLLALPPVPDDVQESVAFIYARAVSAAMMIKTV